MKATGEGDDEDSRPYSNFPMAMGHALMKATKENNVTKLGPQKKMVITSNPRTLFQPQYVKWQ